MKRPLKVEARKPGPAPDALDLEALGAIGENRAYRLIDQRLRETASQLMQRLVAAETWDECRLLQGQIRQLQAALRVPAVLYREIEAKAGKR